MNNGDLTKKDKQITEEANWGRSRKMEVTIPECLIVNQKNGTEQTTVYNKI